MEYGLRPAHLRQNSFDNHVLILVVMEYGLRRTHSLRLCLNTGNVLILVVMEYGLRHVASQHKQKDLVVLILVVMEYGLRLASVFQ